MPFNGSGTFQRLRNWVNDATAGIRIRADYHDSEDDNFASGLSQCITKDGQTTITANLPMAGYKHTNTGAATAITDYLRYDQGQIGKLVWAVAGGSANALTASYTPSTTAPVDGQLYYVRATAANSTTTPTFSPDGQTARTITKNGNQALDVGDITGAGHELILRYRLSDTKYELLNPKTISLNADNSFTGKIRFPDDGELTIASGVITVTGVYHTVDTEGDAATDDLVTINGGSDGQILILRTENDARNVVLKSTGNIDLVADVTLSSADSPIELIYDGALSKWLQRAATAAQGALADTAIQSAAKYTKVGPITATGSALDIVTNIPSDCVSFDVFYSGLSINGTDTILLQIGGASYETTGYAGDVTGGVEGNVNTGNNFSTGILLAGAATSNAASVMHGNIHAELIDPANNIWVFSGTTNYSNTGTGYSLSGSKTITGALQRVRLSTGASFDAGIVGIKYWTPAS